MNICPDTKASYNTNSISINDIRLDAVQELKLLGVTVDYRLTFKTRVHNITSKANSRIYSLKRLRSNGANNKSLLHFYKSCILPVLVYAIEAWYCFITKDLKDNLERTQNYALKLIFTDKESYDQRLEAANLTSISDVFTNRCQATFAKILVNDNNPLNALVKSFINTKRRSARHNHSMFTFSYNTELFKKSFFIRSFSSF
jgi:hypothetical protein